MPRACLHSWACLRARARSQLRLDQLHQATLHSYFDGEKVSSERAILPSRTKHRRKTVLVGDLRRSDSRESRPVVPPGMFTQNPKQETNHLIFSVGTCKSLKIQVQACRQQWGYDYECGELPHFPSRVHSTRAGAQWAAIRNGPT